MELEIPLDEVLPEADIIHAQAEAADLEIIEEFILSQEGTEGTPPRSPPLVLDQVCYVQHQRERLGRGDSPSRSSSSLKLPQLQGWEFPTSFQWIIGDGVTPTWMT